MDNRETIRQDQLALTHCGDHYDRYMNAVVPPVFFNSLHVYDNMEQYYKASAGSEDLYYYGRVNNPTVQILEEKIAELEHGTKAVAFSSGMAAFSAAVLATCKAGSHIICMKDVYMPVKHMIDSVFGPKFNMTVTYVSGDDLEEIEAAVQDNTDLMILESPATFVFRVADLKAIAQIAHRRGFRTYIDNSCLTPLYQKPLEFGIDLVMHTMSKYIGGHSDVIGGILVGKDEALMQSVSDEIRQLFGAIMGPMEAWLTIRGLRTLDVRMQRLQETGLAVANFLEQHEKVKKVYYTGLDSHPQSELIRRQQAGHSSLMSLELKTDSPDDAVRFIDHLQLFGKGCSWGGHESLAIMPLLKESEEAVDLIGGHRNLIRLYCGLEGSENLIADLDQALQQI